MLCYVLVNPRWVGWASPSPPPHAQARARSHPLPQRNLATIAKTIAACEPVSLLVPDDRVALARQLVGECPGVTLVPVPLDDIWVRDYGCVFVHSRTGSPAGVDFNFNGWGGKQVHVPPRSPGGLCRVPTPPPPLGGGTVTLAQKT